MLRELPSQGWRWARSKDSQPSAYVDSAHLGWKIFRKNKFQKVPKKTKPEFAAIIYLAFTLH